MSFEYDDYRKKIEDYFKSELDQIESQIMKKILFIINKQDDLETTIDLAYLFCDKTKTHIKFVNGSHFYSTELSEKNIGYYSLQEIINAVELSPIENAEVSIIKKGEPFEGIIDIVEASQISLIIAQFPFQTGIVSEEANKDNLGKTFEKLIEYALTNSNIPILLLKNDSLHLDSGFNHVVMVATDWINKHSFNTIIHLSNTIKATITILPFLKETLYDDHDIPNTMKKIDKEIEKFGAEVNEWLKKNNYTLTIATESICKNRFEFLIKIDDINPEMIVLFVPRKKEVVSSFQNIIRNSKTNVLIVPEALNKYK